MFVEQPLAFSGSAKNSHCDKTEKLKLWKSSKTQIGIKLNSNCDKTQKLKLWHIGTHIGTKLKTPNLTTQIVTKLKKKIKKKSKDKIVIKPKQFGTKIKNLNPDNSNWQNSLLVRTTWHLDYQWNVLWAAFCDLAMFCCCH